jgi:alkylhydroperoxidase family enzyme
VCALSATFDFGARLEELHERVTEGPGKLSAGVRRAAASGQGVPEEARAYTDKVRRHAYKVVDRNIADLRAAGWSEDQIYELTIEIAMGEGMSRWQHARRVLAEARR